MGNLVCDWLSLTEAHAQRAEPRHDVPQPQDLSAAHFLRVIITPQQTQACLTGAEARDRK